MDGELRSADSHRISRLANKMRDRKDYRASYVASYTRQFLSRQMRDFRGEMSQTEFGSRISKQQTIVSRLEDPNYGKWTLQTLFDVAAKLDIAVLVRFVDFPTFLRTTDDRSPSAISPSSYDQKAVDDLMKEAGTDEEVSQALRQFFDSSNGGAKQSVDFGSNNDRNDPRMNDNNGMRSDTPKVALGQFGYR